MHKLVSLKKEDSIKEFPMVHGLKRAWENPMTSAITRGWKAQMTVTGVSGIPECSNAGNVLLPYNEVKISMRLPPTKNPKDAERSFSKILTEFPPYNAKVIKP